MTNPQATPARRRVSDAVKALTKEAAHQHGLEKGVTNRRRNERYIKEKISKWLKISTEYYSRKANRGAWTVDDLDKLAAFFRICPADLLSGEVQGVDDVDQLHEVDDRLKPTGTVISQTVRNLIAIAVSEDRETLESVPLRRALRTMEKKLADQLGVAWEYYPRKIESGSWKVDDLDTLSDFFELSPAEFVPGPHDVEDAVRAA